MAREHRLRSKYGIGDQDVKTLLQFQGNVCAICKKPSAIWTVDHDHEAESNGDMKIRGILCSTCNTMLGMAHDNPEVLSSAITYLKASAERKPDWPHSLFRLHF